jgi:hypothetical protein
MVLSRWQHTAQNGTITTLFFATSSSPRRKSLVNTAPRRLSEKFFRNSRSQIISTFVEQTFGQAWIIDIFPILNQNHETSGVKLADFEQLLIGCAPAVQLRYGRSASKKTA